MESVGDTNAAAERKKLNSDLGPSLLGFTKKVFNTATPKVATSVLFQAPMLINLLYAGHFSDPTQLAGLALAQAILSALLLCVLVGLNAQHESLFKKAQEMGDKKACGQLHSRARLMLSVLYMPLAGITFLVGKYLLKYLVANDQVANMAEQFI